MSISRSIDTEGLVNVVLPDFCRWNQLLNIISVRPGASHPGMVESRTTPILYRGNRPLARSGARIRLAPGSVVVLIPRQPSDGVLAGVVLRDGKIIAFLKDLDPALWFLVSKTRIRQILALSLVGRQTACVSIALNALIVNRDKLSEDEFNETLDYLENAVSFDASIISNNVVDLFTHWLEEAEKITGTSRDAILSTVRNFIGNNAITHSAVKPTHRFRSIEI